MRTRIKVCGITRCEDALAAAEAGVDAIGLVFYPPSPRHLEIGQAAEIAACLPPFVTTVGLFVNADSETIAEVVDRVGIDLIQFHGNECPDYCAGHRRPWIRALRMKEDIDLVAEAARFDSARGLLLDAYRPGVPGGTGETFDWARIPRALAGCIVLAGGLSPDNVADAVARVHPWGVDVSGGVESAPGIKDRRLIARFVEAVRAGETTDETD
jgi:phosphoribosylanthranilate isomerase